MTESAYLQCFANWWALAGSNTPRVHDHRARPNVLLLQLKLGPITMLDLNIDRAAVYYAPMYFLVCTYVYDIAVCLDHNILHCKMYVQIFFPFRASIGLWCVC